MIITLNSFKDLGYYSFGTNLKQFDTENDWIKINGFDWIKVNSVEDLFPILWTLPYATTKSQDGHIIASFSEQNNRWHLEYDRCVNTSKKVIEKYKKKIDKEWKPDVKTKYIKYLKNEENYLNNIIEMLEKNDQLCEEIKEQLRKENAKNNCTCKH